MSAVERGSLEWLLNPNGMYKESKWLPCSHNSNKERMWVRLEDAEWTVTCFVRFKKDAKCQHS